MPRTSDHASPRRDGSPPARRTARRQERDHDEAAATPAAATRASPRGSRPPSPTLLERVRRLHAPPRTCTPGCARPATGSAWPPSTARCRRWSRTATVDVLRTDDGEAVYRRLLDRTTTTTSSAGRAGARSRWRARPSRRGPTGSAPSTASPTSRHTLEIFGTCADCTGPPTARCSPPIERASVRAPGARAEVARRPGADESAPSASRSVLRLGGVSTAPP